MRQVFIQRSPAAAVFMRGAADKTAVIVTAAVLLALGGVIYLLGDPYETAHEQPNGNADTVADRLAPIGHVVVAPQSAPPVVAARPAAAVTPAPTPAAPAPVAAPAVTVTAPAAPVTPAEPARALPFAPAPGQPRPSTPVLPVQTPAAVAPSVPPVAVRPIVPPMQQPVPYFQPAPRPSWMPHNAPLPLRAYPYAR